MTSSTRFPADPFDLLRLANPVDEATLAPTTQHPPAQATLFAIRLSSALPRRRRNRSLWVMIAAVVSAAAITAAAIAVTHKASVTTGVACFGQPSLGGHIVATGPTAPTAIETCAKAWAEGRFGTAQTPPPLIDCVLESGAVGVFPSTDPALCDRLGLARHDPAQRLDTDPAVILAERLSDRVATGVCYDEATTERYIRDQLPGLGIAGWTVVPPPDARNGPCYTGSVDSKNHAIHVAPQPNGSTTTR
jgi:hypothetical protein